MPIMAARDGHDFIVAAAQGGASATLLGAGRTLPSGADQLTVVEVDDTLVGLSSLGRHAREQITGPVVGITGSNGKTTTRAFVEAALATGFEPVTCTRGNLNNHLGVPLTLVDEPHAPAAAVLELGMSAAGENDHLAGIVRPNVHVITSIALEHLEFMGSLANIAAAEAEPIAHLQPGSDGRPPALVVPADEPSLRAHLPGPKTGVRVLRVGPVGGADDDLLDVAITEVEVGVRTRAVLRLRSGERLVVQLASFGAHNARNAASAVAVAVHLGLPLAPLVDALEAVAPVGDRGRLQQLGPHLLIADCYNANPGSMIAALDSLARLRATRRGPLLAVLGDMLELGPTQAQLHREIGAHAARLGLDGVLGFGPLAKEIAAAADAAGVVAGHVSGVSGVSGEPGSVEAAVAWVRARLADCGADAGAVLFKGSRGMRLERVVAALHD
ncbi:UDP-N-acetylmuramoylalanyl-D-glutamyl-2,6-diaminopimelate--D-alanyl-D-alanine ligase [Enhygromyxa salina]|uniref:UDP-N-acetylmuramoylalanyl-D-glutamyl-2, 6-diaminopimelate--D-alanyl-D-alanine ligase n=1 Tax=Enhygromyxa salina TaxID=215803 RepID=A0A0C1ZCW8_9BACT|nr:UDP-N-acetylmuramoylalanyl-D-glutamyl-2,6-diaminopimelate--D-alanyl-D-alanine ligase [Enhygromyxa salina]